MITAAIVSFGVLFIGWLFAPGDRPEAEVLAVPEESILEAA
jgi:hypothetical protein